MRYALITTVLLVLLTSTAEADSRRKTSNNSTRLLEIADMKLICLQDMNNIDTVEGKDTILLTRIARTLISRGVPREEALFFTLRGIDGIHGNCVIRKLEERLRDK